MTGKLRQGASNLAGISLIALVWYGVSLFTPAYILPRPETVVARIWEWGLAAPSLASYGLTASGLLPNLWVTMQTVVASQLLALSIGVPLGLASANHSRLRAAINPIVMTGTTVPILVLAPFFLVWFGVGRTTSVLLVLLYGISLFTIYSQRAGRALSPVYADSARALGASRWRVLRDVLFPAAVPAIIGALRVSLSGAWGLAAIAELLGASSGTGVMIRVLVGQFDVVGLMAVIILICAVALFADFLVFLLGRLLLRWRAE
ncbi:ABC transporter permease [Salipiger abyssi]|uniref:ABC transporter permease n=1 Tax=Salipiger abyssi TaxID=1250539 RepID=UPI004059AFA4